MKGYVVNEIFYSLQGEGVRAGTANLFLRLSGCNQTCALESHGFDCDTEFVSGRRQSASEIIGEFRRLSSDCCWVVVTGGEPGLQLDRALLDELHGAHYRVAVETNGSVVLPEGIDWITVSPKVAEHAIRQRVANEVKYVRSYGQGIPKTCVKADYHLISPAFQGNDLPLENLEWCIQLVRNNPDWRLSLQQHKGWRVR